MPGPLHKSTIVVWTEYEPSSLELEDLAREATSGDAYCSSSVSEYVEHPETDPAWDGTEFFDQPDGGEA